MRSIHDIYNQIFKIWRKKRFHRFLATLQPTPSDVLVDVGGYPWFWTSQNQPVGTIDTINIHEVPWRKESFPNHNVRTFVGDGCALKLPDRAYDIGFSNSVIEHVGTWERQQLFASEIRRVSNALWVQTPAYECPLEPHYMAPFIHYLPPKVRRKIVRWCTPWGWLTKPGPKDVDIMVDTTRLIRLSEMKELFPDCQIIVERMFGVIPKSYIAVRRRNRDSAARVPVDRATD